MAWFRKDKKPRRPRREKLEIPVDAWEKCEVCDYTDITEKFVRNLNVCPNCGHHRRIRANDYVSILLDEGTAEETEIDIRSTDPLGFPEYAQRLKKATANAGEGDAILTYSGQLGGAPVNVGVMDFAFMGGSMGSVVGEKIARLGQRSLEKKHPLVIVASSGGARMQEGVLSLMQMAKASAMLSQLAERRVPYVSILTNPTTGGVSASFAMLGDAILAEPGAVIGFAGPRVIKQTIGQDLPEGFQTAEFLLEHGIVDMVVPRQTQADGGSALTPHEWQARGVRMAVTLTPYQSAVSALFARTAGAIKPGLERTEALLMALDNPHTKYPCFHVAGTNGKGSVCATMDVLLRYKGRRVGRYASPHLIDFRERIVVNGVPISEEEVVEFLQRVDAQAQQIGATFFEITTAMAFWYFAKENVDVAVIETGMGGLHDATNVVMPVVATVTNISLDHTEFLGQTLQDIAREKAGIFKPGRPAVIGEARPEVGRMLATLAQERGAKPISTVRTEWRSWSVTYGLNGTTFNAGTPAGEFRITTPLHGEHQVRNTLTAIASLWLANGAYRIPMTDVNKALAKLQLPGRFQRVDDWVFDVAHNAAGARTLAEAIRAAKLARPVTAVVAVLGDKEWQAVLEALAPMVDRMIITQAPSAPPERAWDPMAAAMHANKLRVPVDLEVNFDSALQRAQEAKGAKVITGSFHTVGDAMQRLGVNPLDTSPVARGAPTR